MDVDLGEVRHLRTWPPITPETGEQKRHLTPSMSSSLRFETRQRTVKSVEVITSGDWDLLVLIERSALLPYEAILGNLENRPELALKMPRTVSFLISKTRLEERTEEEFFDLGHFMDTFRKSDFFPKAIEELEEKFRPLAGNRPWRVLIFDDSRARGFSEAAAREVILRAASGLGIRIVSADTEYFYGRAGEENRIDWMDDIIRSSFHDPRLSSIYGFSQPERVVYRYIRNLIKGEYVNESDNEKPLAKKEDFEELAGLVAEKERVRINSFEYLKEIYDEKDILDFPRKVREMFRDIGREAAA